MWAVDSFKPFFSLYTALKHFLMSTSWGSQEAAKSLSHLFFFPSLLSLILHTMFFFSAYLPSPSLINLAPSFTISLTFFFAFLRVHLKDSFTIGPSSRVKASHSLTSDHGRCECVCYMHISMGEFTQVCRSCRWWGPLVRSDSALALKMPPCSLAECQFVSEIEADQCGRRHDVICVMEADRGLPPRASRTLCCLSVIVHVDCVRFLNWSWIKASVGVLISEGGPRPVTTPFDTGGEPESRHVRPP